MDKLARKVDIHHAAMQGSYFAGFSAIWGFGPVLLLYLGLSNSTLGVVTSLALVLPLLLQPALAALSDADSRWTSRRLALVLSLLTLAAAVVMTVSTGSKTVLVAAYAVIGVLLVSTSPFFNSMVMEYHLRGVNVNYGLGRGTGSTTYAIVALVLGFTFSFAWTPCVGPVLASVLLMASSSASAAAGFGLVAVYTLGFILPFLAVGLFTGEVLRFFRTHGNVVKYTVKVGGALLIVMGVMTVTGWMNGVTSYLSSFGGAPAAQEQPADQGDNASKGDSGSGGGSASGDAGADDADAQPAPLADLKLVDQNGVEHSLDEYRGKTVFLNFWATWCGPCQREIPDIEKLYRDRGEKEGDLVVLGVANPKTDSHPNNNDVSEGEVKAFIDENGITYPVLMDVDGALFDAYRIMSFPTTFMIDKDGNIFGYISGMLTPDMMDSIVEQTMSGERK